ncbi:MAG: DUF3892 domain-containing protein [Agathobacter sp.]|nr:DUF3892 domain-containing protein [Agathobacter sp.]
MAFHIFNKLFLIFYETLICSIYIKSLPDGTEGNNLGNLPSVTESELSSNAKG